MSLESALDEERRAVMELLEGRSMAPRPARRDGSPRVGSRAQSPAVAVSPMRSMLDIDDPPSSPGGRAASISSGYRSMLDTSSPPPSGLRNSSRGPMPSSPPPSARSLPGSSVNPVSAYQFEMLPTIEAHSMPKRVTQGGKKNKQRAMASVYGGSETGGSSRGEQRQSSFGGLLGKKSGSPGPGRSQSPGGRKLNTNSFNLMPTPGKYVTDTGKVVDMSSAYRRLSDAALLRSGGTLSNLPSRKGSDPTRGESLAPGGGVRLATDDFGDDEDAIESSDDYESDGSSDGEGWGSQKRRGRRRTRQNNGSEKHGGEPRITKSLLAAAEEERKEQQSSYRVKSLLEPTINVTGPDGKQMANKKSGVHPNTNFDQGGSGFSTPMSSDTEADLSEVKAAQQMAMNISPIHSSPEAHRCVRQILRGKYGQFHDDADNGLRRQRVYLVATDLSEEAAYALEWTIGTVLRDGDTLLAVYAVDEEIGVGGADGTGVAIGGGATAQQETDSLMKTLSNTKGISEAHKPSPLQNSVSASESDVNAMNKAEKERYQAAVEVSDRCVKLLRKTRLQVRVVVEVFHCKSPKHMITEVIDFLEPTLVILGSRGRSALKGVLLGSFSNYLVTKSSVPVMVARKRLRKHSKYKRKNLRLSNVLTNPTGRLANAKVD
ncbi:hypothetical protein BU24DRAFT_13561 [Aaosphaeria arxii CBS 175.79]|uniref:UspA domain-containing protein n=1 Tax=Aaosphaeria arxii CBS 175.79 TaxID=1450172 RepID=A0A6A5Y6V7_9PLEO|nr:uncharacterized protein BU24DRAFT_13561 [Aaosphaeria arxii CBS 175.79]KAF2021029.1 hypothetical protein BU24DRAFT_13561 [Aaosphaeria arxii CBS 175.79]